MGGAITLSKIAKIGIVQKSQKRMKVEDCNRVNNKGGVIPTVGNVGKQKSERDFIGKSGFCQGYREINGEKSYRIFIHNG